MDKWFARVLYGLYDLRTKSDSIQLMSSSKLENQVYDISNARSQHACDLRNSKTKTPKCVARWAQDRSGMCDVSLTLQGKINDVDDSS